MKRITAIFFTLAFSLGAWADLPPQMEADRLLLQAKATLDAGNFESTIQSFEKAEALNVKMPETFYFHFGKAYSGTKKWFKARSAFEKYLLQTGTGGKFYREALEGFNQADVESARAESAEKARLADEKMRIRTEQDRVDANRLKRKVKYEADLAKYRADSASYESRVLAADARYAQDMAWQQDSEAKCKKMGGFFGSEVKAMECYQRLGYPTRHTVEKPVPPAVLD